MATAEKHTSVPTNLEALGVFTFESLQRAQQSQPGDLVEGLIRDRSINLLVGASGLGKTPLAVALGVAVASGRPFLGRRVSPGSVLYCDAESGRREFLRLLTTISQTANVPEPPRDLHVWSPNFEEGSPDLKSWGSRLFERVRAVAPRLVIVDPLRAFWPGAEKKAEEAMKIIRAQRELSREIGCSWLELHHRRKTDRESPVSLENDRHAWFEEAAGSHALVNGADTRLGVERSDEPADLLLAGFVRSVGWVGPVRLQRLTDEDGEPVGYKVLTGVDHLSQRYQEAFQQLTSTFRFKDALNALGGRSASSAKEFLHQCIAAGLLRKETKEYVKVDA